VLLVDLTVSMALLANCASDHVLVVSTVMPDLSALSKLGNWFEIMKQQTLTFCVLHV